jgi:hypothetical protein
MAHNTSNKQQKNIYTGCPRRNVPDFGRVLDFLATDPEIRVRFPALADFLRSCGSGTGSTKPREYNRGTT